MPAQTTGKKLAKASGEPAPRYPKIGAGKGLNWKKPNPAGGTGVNAKG